MSTQTIFTGHDAGQILREARRRRRLTQIELAQHANVSRGVVQKLEEGRGTVNLDTVIKIASILGIDVRLVERG
ncbi:MAG: helix-turn-helix transcriptional regulator [Chloroflexi bacterium]|nr:helix-turn-helix transcriptional regulator [Chloroflexota bacterium]MBI2983962.1 helix-turn-helix transcriptional regulator [Chloroflexota bacterium]